MYSNNQTAVDKTATVLGIDIDNNVNLKSHIYKLKKQLSSLIFSLTNLKKTTHFKTG